MQTGKKNKILTLTTLMLFGIAVLLVGCNQSEKKIDTQKTKATEPDIATTLPTARAYTSTPAVTITPTPTPEPVSPLGIGAADLSGITIEFWHIWSGPAGEVINDLVNSFNLENPWGIQAQATYQGNLDEMNSSLLSAIDQNQPPDLVIGYHYQALNWNENWELVDLNLYMDDPLWGLKPDEQSDFYPVFWDHDQLNEQRIGLPAQRSAQVLFYNRSWAEELGFSAPPADLEEFKRQACVASIANQNDANPENDGTGGWIISTNYSAILGWMNAHGAEITTSSSPDTEESGYQFDTPEVEETFTFLRELYEEGCAWLSEDAYPDLDFASRRGLFASDSVTAIQSIQDAFRQTGNIDNWTVLPFPAGAEEPSISVYGPSYEILTSTAKEQLAAWLLAKWMLTPVNQARLIETTQTLPLRNVVLEILLDKQSLPPQWSAAADLLAQARAEPTLQSWNLVRWAVRDAATQLFRYYFTIDQLPDTIEFLNQTANDLHQDPLHDSSIKTPTVTATATLKATASQTTTVTPTP